MKKFIIVISLWIISLLFVTIWTYENPEKIEILKNYFKKNKNITAEIQNTQKSERIAANSFFVKIPTSNGGNSFKKSCFNCFNL